MPGTLTITTLSDGTNSTSATNCISGSAKAWVNFNGVTTATIRASYNVSSVTRNGTGDYTINFTSALADANYAFASQGQRQTAIAPSGIDSVVSTCGTTAPTASALRVITSNGAGGAEDFTYVAVAIFR